MLIRGNKLYLAGTRINNPRDIDTNVRAYLNNIESSYKYKMSKNALLKGKIVNGYQIYNLLWRQGGATNKKKRLPTTPPCSGDRGGARCPPPVTRAGRPALASGGGNWPRGGEGVREGPRELLSG